MTPDAWNALSGIMTPIGLAVASLVFGIVGFFIVREIRQNDEYKRELKNEIKSLESRIMALTIKLTAVTTVLEDRRMMPSAKLKFPSPPPTCVEDSTG